MGEQCEHLDFKASVGVGRLVSSETGKVDQYAAEVRVQCAHCGQEFAFYGLPVGMSAYRPTTSLDGLELCAPLVIPGTKPPAGKPGYLVSIPEESLS